MTTTTTTTDEGGTEVTPQGVEALAVEAVQAAATAEATAEQAQETATETAEEIEQINEEVKGVIEWQASLTRQIEAMQTTQAQHQAMLERLAELSATTLEALQKILPILLAEKSAVAMPTIAPASDASLAVPVEIPPEIPPKSEQRQEAEKTRRWI